MSTSVQKIRTTALASLTALFLWLSMPAVHSQVICQAGYTFSVNNNVVTFTNTSTGGNMPSYFWSFGDGNYDWQANTIHTFLYNGAYSVCLTMYDSLNQGCQSTFCDSVIITNAPNPPCSAYFIYASDSSNQLPGISFYDQSLYQPVSWSWNFGDGNTSTLQNPVHTYSVTGNYLVCLTIINSFSDTCTYCDTVGYFPCTLSGGFTINSTNDPQISFTNTSTGGGAPFYSWNFGDGSYSSSVSPTHTYQYNGTYVACLTAYDSLNGNCYVVVCDSIVIAGGANPPCNAAFYAWGDSNNTFPGTFYFVDYSTGGPVSWSWNFGDGGTSTQQNPTHTYTLIGTYTVCLTINTQSSGSCTMCDTVSYKTQGAGVMEQNNLTSIKNYPNPFTSSTVFSYSLDHEANVELTICDVTGRKISELVNENQSAGTHRAEWTPGDLPSGIYWMKMNAGENMVTRKLVLIK
jgi:PKD repeat protein